MPGGILNFQAKSAIIRQIAIIRLEETNANSIQRIQRDHGKTHEFSVDFFLKTSIKCRKVCGWKEEGKPVYEQASEGDGKSNTENLNFRT